MRVLMIHNTYRQRGGEDVTFESERDILVAAGHEVRTIVFNNDQTETGWEQVKTALGLFYNSRSAAEVASLVDEFRPDIAHVYNIFYTASPSVLYALHRRKIPIILTIQNYRLVCAGGLLMRQGQVCEICVNQTFPLGGAIHRCHRDSAIQSAHLILVTGTHKALGTWTSKPTAYLTLTAFQRKKLLESSLHLSEDKVLVKPNSIADMGASPFSKREPYIVFVGRLSHEKGITTLLEAFQNSTVRLEIIGDGPFRPQVERMASLNSNIIYHGFRDRNFITDKLKRSAVLVMTSICYECLPTTILEAFSTGTPVIISDIGNLNEIVSHNVNGLHFRTGDSADLARVAGDFMSNRDSYSALYTQARQTYLDRYEPSLNRRNLEEIYNKVLSGRI